jgi:hypothetical protein
LQAEEPIHFSLLNQIERLLGRRPDPNEPHAQVASDMKDHIDAREQAGILPQDPNLIHALEQHFARQIFPGESAAPLISQLLQDASRATTGAAEANAPFTIPVPAALAKIMSPLPHQFKWLATLLAPLVMSGGLGIPMWMHSVNGVQAKLDDAKHQIVKLQRKSEIDDQLKTLEPKQPQSPPPAAEESKAANELPTQNQSLVTKNNDLVKANKKLEQEVRAQQNQIAQVKNATPKSGYVVWQSSGGSKVNFQGGPDAGFILDGAFPPGPCRVQSVFGDHLNAKKAMGADCHNFAFEVKSKTTIYILWRAE